MGVTVAGRWTLVVQVLMSGNRPKMADDRKIIWLVKYGARQLAVTQPTRGLEDVHQEGPGD